MKGFSNKTKHVYVQNKSWLNVQKHKSGNLTVLTQQFVSTNLYVSCLNKRAVNKNSTFQLL